MDQAERLVAHDPVRDVVAYLRHSVPGVEIYFDDQAVDGHSYDAVVARRPEGLSHLDTGDDCDVVDGDRLDPAGEATLQGLVDQYFAELVDLCASVADCTTDGGALQDIQVADADISPDLDHFAVPGLAKVADVVWSTLPEAWTSAP
jgi:hypothetical protein